MKKIFSVIFRITITLALLIFLFRRVDIISIWQVIKSLNPLLFIYAFLLNLFLVIVGAFRWQMLLDALQLRIKRRRVIISSLGAQFFNLFLPSTIGGDVARSVDLFGHTKSGSRIVASVILDRLSGFAGLAILSSVGLIFGYKLFERNVILPILALFSLVIVLFFFMFNKKITMKFIGFLGRFINKKAINKIESLYESLSFFTKQKKLLAENIALSIFAHLVFACTFYILAMAIGVKQHIVYFIIFVPIITAISSLPISIGGLGLRDLSAVYFFGRIGISKDVAFSMSLITFFFMVVIGLIGGIIYVSTLRYRRIQSHQEHLNISK